MFPLTPFVLPTPPLQNISKYSGGDARRPYRLGSKKSCRRGPPPRSRYFMSASFRRDRRIPPGEPNCRLLYFLSRCLDIRRYDERVLGLTQNVCELFRGDEEVAERPLHPLVRKEVQEERRCRPTAPDDPGFEPVLFIGVDVLAETHYFSVNRTATFLGLNVRGCLVQPRDRPAIVSTRAWNEPSRSAIRRRSVFNGVSHIALQLDRAR